MRSEIICLVQENVSIEDIIQFIAKEKGIPYFVAEQKVQQVLQKKNVKFSYKIFEKKEEEEKKYFLKLAKSKSIDELAEIFAELSLMLERALILNSFYSFKLKKLQEEKEGRRDEEKAKKVE